MVRMGLQGPRRDGAVTPSLFTRYPQLGITPREWVLLVAVGHVTAQTLTLRAGQPRLGQACISPAVAGVTAFAAMIPDFRSSMEHPHPSGYIPGPARGGRGRRWLDAAGVVQWPTSDTADLDRLAGRAGVHHLSAAQVDADVADRGVEEQ